MHGRVQSQSFNGDGKVLHYTVEWKDSMHIGFPFFGNQVPGLPKRVLHYFESLTNIDDEKIYQMGRSFPREIFLLPKRYACNVQIFLIFLKSFWEIVEIDCVGRYFIVLRRISL